MRSLITGNIMKDIDLILDFLNSDEFEESYIIDFERQLLGNRYDISIEEKKEALMNIKEELDTIIRDLVIDHTDCSDFVGWLTDYIIPEVVPFLTKNPKSNRNFELVIATADIIDGTDFEEDLKTRIATKLYQEFQTKNIFYLQVCQNCNKIYIPKRLNKAAKFCDEDCKHAYWMNNHPEKKKEYKNKRKTFL